MRAFSLIEYLVTYGTALVVSAILVIVLYHSGLSKSSSLLGTTCLPSSGYICGTPALFQNGSMVVRFGMTTGQTVLLTAIACTTNSTAPATMTSMSPIELGSGQTVSLAFPCALQSDSVGSGFTGYLWIQYNDQAQVGGKGMMGSITATVLQQPSS